MNIAVDGWPLVVRSGGIGVYTRELLQALVEVDGVNEYYLHGVTRRVKRAGPEDIVPLEVSRTSGKAMRDVASRVYQSVRLSKFGDWAAAVRAHQVERTLARSGMDVYFGTCFLGLFHPSFKTVLTIHDMAFRYYPERIQPVMFHVLSRQLQDHAQRAAAIVADSEHTRRDIASLLSVDPAKVSLVYPGVSDRFCPIDDAPALQQLRRRQGLPERFLLFVGTVEPRKNLRVLIAAFDLLCGDAQFSHGLVIAGNKGWRDRAIVAALEGSRHRDRIACTGFLPDREMPALYNSADVLVLPSWYEGFGLPVAEALACGTNVVASNVSSLPEVAGDAGLLFDPQSAEQLADAVRRLLRDEALCQSLRERGFQHVRKFRWDVAARQVVAVFNQVTGQSTAGTPAAEDVGKTPQG